MSKIHYFQRYSQRENVATNNTLLLFSRLYNDSIYKFNEFINELLGEENISEGKLDVGVSFTQQEKAENSVPDGVISQNSFKIAIETKLGSGKNFGEAQLIHHIKSFSNEDTKILIALSSTKMENELFKKVEEECKNEANKVLFLNITFKEIINAFSSVLNEYDFQLKEIINDYEEYCYHENLISDKEFRMRVIPCGGSHELNMKYGIYYMPSDRGTSEHTFIGIYTNKSVIGIGKIVNEIKADFINSELKINSSKVGYSEEQKQKIIDMEKETREKLGWNLGRCEHKYYIVDKFHETNYRKTSKGGIQGHRYFNLKDILKVEKLPELKEIAKQLNGKNWEKDLENN